MSYSFSYFWSELNNRAAFIDFCQGLLNLNPVTRWTPQQARLHPFITGEKYTKPFVVRVCSVSYLKDIDEQPPFCSLMVFLLHRRLHPTLNVRMVVSYLHNPRGRGLTRMQRRTTIISHSIKHIPPKHSLKQQTLSGILTSTRRILSTQRQIIILPLRPSLQPIKRNNRPQLRRSSNTLNLYQTHLQLPTAALRIRVQRVTLEAFSPVLSIQIMQLEQHLVQATSPQVYLLIHTFRVIELARTLLTKWIQRYPQLLPVFST